MAKIAAADNSAMNKLYAQEMGFKFASEDSDRQGSQAFADHKEYLDTVQKILSMDEKGNGQGSFSKEELDVTLD